MRIFNADVIINIPPAFFSLQKSGLVRVYLTSVFLLLSVPRCFSDQKPQFDYSAKNWKSSTASLASALLSLQVLSIRLTSFFFFSSFRFFQHLSEVWLEFPQWEHLFWVWPSALLFKFSFFPPSSFFSKEEFFLVSGLPLASFFPEVWFFFKQHFDSQ